MSVAKVDNPSVEAPKPAKRYVTIPERDLFDQPHPAIRINHFTFASGTHYLDAELANTVEERLLAYTRANIRILQPTRDISSEKLLERGQGIATTNFQ